MLFDLFALIFGLILLTIWLQWKGGLHDKSGSALLLFILAVSVGFVKYNSKQGMVESNFSTVLLAKEIPTMEVPQKAFQCNFDYLIKYLTTPEDMYDILLFAVEAELQQLENMKHSILISTEFRDYLYKLKDEKSKELNAAFVKLNAAFGPSKDLVEENAKLIGQLCAIDKLIYLINFHSLEKSTEKQ